MSAATDRQRELLREREFALHSARVFRWSAKKAETPGLRVWWLKESLDEYARARRIKRQLLRSFGAAS